MTIIVIHVSNSDSKQGHRNILVAAGFDKILLLLGRILVGQMQRRAGWDSLYKKRVPVGEHKRSKGAEVFILAERILS